MRIFSIRIFSAEVLHDGTSQLNCMIFIMCQVVRDTRLMRMEIATSELLIGDNLARSSLDQRRSAKEDRALVLDNDYLVRHGWHVGSSSSARAHDNRDLRDTCSGHPRLVVKNLTKVILIWEYIVLLGQECTR